MLFTYLARKLRDERGMKEILLLFFPVCFRTSRLPDGFTETEKQELGLFPIIHLTDACRAIFRGSDFAGLPTATDAERTSNATGKNVNEPAAAETFKRISSPCAMSPYRNIETKESHVKGTERDVDRLSALNHGRAANRGDRWNCPTISVTARHK